MDVFRSPACPGIFDSPTCRDDTGPRSHDANRLRFSNSMESARGCGTSQNNFNMAPLPRGLWFVSGLPAPTNGHPVSLHPGLCARTCMAQPNRSLEAAGETFLKRFPAQAPSPAFTTARYGHDDGHQPPPVHDRLAQHSGSGGLSSMTGILGTGKNGDDFFCVDAYGSRQAFACHEHPTTARTRGERAALFKDYRVL